MGARGDIVIEFGDAGQVVFYAHNGGWETAAIVQHVLKRELRWDNASYLARMIFCAMVRDNTNGELGYGISSLEAGDAEFHPTIVNMEHQTVKIGHEGHELSFRAFCNTRLLPENPPIWDPVPGVETEHFPRDLDRLRYVAIAGGPDE